jgi:nucleoside-diphosphate-sugar epimerase
VKTQLDSDSSAEDRAYRALVTGSAGFLGSQLAERLIADGHEVVGVDCFTDFYPRDIKEANVAALRDSSDFTLHEVDLADHPLDELLDGIDVIYHLAAQAGVRGSFGDGFEHYIHHNVHASQRLLEAATRHPVSRFVYASSSSVYGNAISYPTDETAARAPVSPYGMTKCATEDLAGVYARNQGLHTVGLRYFTAYGPRQRPDMAFSRFFKAALSDEALKILGDGLQVRDFTYVDDVIEGTLRAAENGAAGRVYNIGGGTPVTLLGAVEIIRELTGRDIAVEHLESARGDARQTTSDPGLARDEIGFQPSVELQDGLARQLEWTLERSPIGLRAA